MSGLIDIIYDDGRPHSRIEVAGEFSNWQGLPLGLDNGTRYAAIFDGAQPGSTYQYKFIVDGQWQLLSGLPTVTDTAGFVNHSIEAQPQAQYGETGVAGQHQTNATGGAFSTGNTSRSVNEGSSAGGSGAGADSALGNSAVGGATSGVTGLFGASNESAGDEYPDTEQDEFYDSLSGSKFGIGGQGASSNFSASDASPYSAGAGQLDRIDEQSTTADRSGFSGDSGIPGGTGLYSTSNQPQANSYAAASPGLTGQGSTGHSSTGYGSTGQGSTGQGSTGFGSKGFGSTGQGLTGQGSTGQGSTGQGAAGISTGQGAQTPTTEPYEIVGSELERPTERVEGLDQLNTQPGSTSQGLKSEPYELQGSQLDKPTEKVPGLDRVENQQIFGSTSNSQYQPQEADQGVTRPITDIYGSGEPQSQDREHFASVASSSGQKSSSESYEVIGKDLDASPVKTSSAEHYVTGVPIVSAPLASVPLTSVPISSVPYTGAAGTSTGFGASELEKEQNDPEPYDLKGSQLDHPTEKVSGLDAIGSGQSKEPRSSAYGFDAGNLSNNAYDKNSTGKEAFDQSYYDKQSLDNSSNLAASSAIPGSLPFEEKLTGRVDPEKVTEGTLGAIGGKNASKGADSGYIDAETSVHNDFADRSMFTSADTQNYGSAAEDYDDDADAVQAALARAGLIDSPSDLKHGGSGRGTSDKPTYPSYATELAEESNDPLDDLRRDPLRQGAYSYGTTQLDDEPFGTIEKPSEFEHERESSLDPSAAERAVKDTPTSAKSTYTGSRGAHDGSASFTSSPTSYASHSPKRHVPIDVSTGFPVDNPQDLGQSSSSGPRQQHRSLGGVPTLRQDSKRPMSHTGLPSTLSAGHGSTGSSNENRNAAVIAAASRASAFAKQDVAAISSPQQYHPQQQSTRPSKERRRPLSASFLSHGKKPSSSGVSARSDAPSEPSISGRRSTGSAFSGSGGGSAPSALSGTHSGSADLTSPDFNSSGLASANSAVGGAGVGAGSSAAGATEAVGSGLGGSSHIPSGTAASGLSNPAGTARGELGGATSSFDRQRQGVSSELQRAGSRREGKVKSFFRKLASK